MWVVLLIPVFIAAVVLITGAIGIFLGVNSPRPRFLPSDIYFPQRKYKNWSARQGWSRASHLFYECGICHKSLPSETTVARECGCGNLFVGSDHIGAGDSAKVRSFEE